MIKTDENYLLKELSKGNVDAFDFLYRKYVPKLSCFAILLLKDKEVVEDIVHDIFVKIWEKRGNLYRINSFSNYLFQMTKFAIYDYFDHQMVEERFIISQNKSENSESYSFEDKIDTDDLYYFISLAINNMPPQRRKIFKMSRYSRMSNKKIAESLGISVKTVENHICQALKDLRKVIAYMMFFTV